MVTAAVRVARHEPVAEPNREAGAEDSIEAVVVACAHACQSQQDDRVGRVLLDYAVGKAPTGEEQERHHQCAMTPAKRVTNQDQRDADAHLAGNHEL